MSKLNIGVIGAGGIARRRTIPALRRARNCRVTAVMDVVGIEEVAAELKIGRHYSKEAELVCDPDVAAVYIASPVHLHLRHIKLAAEHGKHILCEKPLARNVTEAREAVAVCKRHKVVLQEGYMMKFHGGHARMRELVADGKLGEIVSMRAQLACWYPPMDGAWRQDPRKGGGGALVDMATHLFDLLEHLADDRIKRVAALISRRVHGYKSEDAATILLEFASGAHATVDTFFCIPDEASKTRLELYGSRGSLLAEGTVGQGSGGKITGILGLDPGGYDATQGKDVPTGFSAVKFPRINPYTAECEYFADCIQAGRAPALNDGANAIHIMNVSEQAYASYKQKQILGV